MSSGMVQSLSSPVGPRLLFFFFLLVFLGCDHRSGLSLLPRLPRSTDSFTPNDLKSRGDSDFIPTQKISFDGKFYSESRISLCSGSERRIFGKSNKKKKEIPCFISLMFFSLVFLFFSFLYSYR
jgi:hypothetical protein